MTEPEIVVLKDPAIEQAVIFINNKVEQTVYEGAVEIGEYVLEHFLIMISAWFLQKIRISR